MRRYITDLRIVVTLLFTLATVGKVSAQDSLRRAFKWYVPDFVVAQYAGSIGFIAAGAGYDIFHKKANIDVLGGYVPAFTGSRPLAAITLKFTAMPLKARVGKTRDITLHPLTTGVYFTYTPGKDYSSDLPAWYPSGYYWWSEAVRVNIFIGGNVNFASNRLRPGSRVTAYYEIGTNEIKLVSYLQNRDALNIWNILHAGIGARYHFAR